MASHTYCGRSIAITMAVFSDSTRYTTSSEEATLHLGSLGHLALLGHVVANGRDDAVAVAIWLIPHHLALTHLAYVVDIPEDCAMGECGTESVVVGHLVEHLLGWCLGHEPMCEHTFGVRCRVFVEHVVGQKE